MTFQKILLLISTILVLIHPSISSAEVKQIAVLDFRGINLEKALLEDLVEQSRQAVSTFQKEEYQVITREDLIQNLDNKGRDSICIDERCALEIGQEIGADFMITGNLLKIEGQYLLILKLFDVQNGTLLKMLSVEAKNISALNGRTYRKSVALLKEGLTPKERCCKRKDNTSTKISYLSVDPQFPFEMNIFLDGEYLGKLPLRNVEIEPGSHVLNIQNECYRGQELAFSVEVGQTKEGVTYFV